MLAHLLLRTPKLHSTPLALYWNPIDFVAAPVLEECVTDDEWVKISDVYKCLTVVIVVTKIMSLHHMFEQYHLLEASCVLHAHKKNLLFTISEICIGDAIVQL